AQMLGNGQTDAVFPVLKVGHPLVGPHIGKGPAALVNKVGNGGLSAVQVVVAHAVGIGRQNEIVDDHHREGQRTVDDHPAQLRLLGTGHVGAQDQQTVDILENIAHLLSETAVGVIVTDQNAAA